MSSVVVFDSAALAVLFIILFYLHNSPQVEMVFNGYFKSLIGFTVVGIGIEIFAYYYSKHYMGYNVEIMNLLNSLYFVTFIAVSVLLALYNINFFGTYFFIKKITKIIFIIPALLGVIFVVLNIKTGMIFYHNHIGVYTRGDYYYLFFVIPLIYLLISFYSIYINSELQPVEMVTMLRKVMIVIWSVSLIHIFIPDVISIFPCVTIGIMSFVLGGGCYNSHVNWKIQMFKKKCFEGSIRKYSNTRKAYTVYVIRINDSNYHKKIYGDEYYEGMMVKISDYLKGLFKHCRCYQLDDFSFGIIIPDNVKLKEEKIIGELTRKFTRRWTWRDIETRLKARVGIFRFPIDTDNPEEIFESVQAICSNDNMKRGVEIVRIYEASYSKYARGIEIEKLINQALKEKRFEIYYQPIFSVKKKKVVSAEALVRLRDNEMNFVSPDEFIPIAEKNGSVIEIGELVFEEVCKFISERDMEELGLECIDINLSPVQTLQYRLSERLLGIMRIYGIDSKYINLEITETASSDKSDALIRNINNLSGHGIKFSLDDYGTGFSNMSSLISLPFSFIKIDKTILWDSFVDKKADEIFTSMIELFKKLDISVVVEGVEDEAMIEKSIKAGCEYLQGYYYSRPLPKEDFISYLK